METLRRSFLMTGILLLCLSTFSQKRTGLFMSPEEKAFMWHVVVKSPVLDRNIGMFFEYTGDTVYIDEKIWDYDSMATLITMEPTTLKIDYHGLSNVRSGLLLETVTKMALWKLHKALSEGEDSDEDSDENNLYDATIKGIRGRVPEAALRKRGGKQELKPDIIDLVDPTLPMGEKIEMVGSTNLTLREQLYVLQAINDTYVEYIKKEGFRLFKLLGGHTDGFDNLLLAAGEGSGTAGLLGEVEKDENGKPNEKKPIGIGLFTYKLDLGKNDAGEDAIIIKNAPIEVFQGFAGGDVTTIHMSIWGFNSFFQTTVVVKAEGRSYLLYGSKYSRELNPDSTFGRGKTYHRHIETLKEDIAELDHQIEGEDGYRARVERNKELEQQALEGVREAEKELKEYKLTNNRKRYKIAQSKFLTYSQTYEKRKERTKVSIERLQEAEDRLEYLQDKLYEMETNIGDDIVPWTKKDSLYIFEDGSVFNSYTQDFRFGRSMGHRKFMVRLISIGTRPLSKKVDEVQLYVNLTERPKEEIIDIQLTLEDAFGPDEFELEQLSIDSAKEKRSERLLEYIVDRNPRFIFDLKGYGVGMRNKDGEIVDAKDEASEQLDSYPGRSREKQMASRNDPEFRDLRVARVNIAVEGHVYIDIDSYTDPVRSSLSVSDTTFQKLMMELHIPTGNDLLSGLRIFGILEALQRELLSRLEDVDPEDFQKITEANKRLSNMIDNAVVLIGDARLTYRHYQLLSD